MFVSVYDKLFNGIGFNDWNINWEVYVLDYGLYGEFGLIDCLNIMVSFFFKYVRVGGLMEMFDVFFNLLEEGFIYGLSNVWLGLKYGILDKDLKVVILVIISLNIVIIDFERGLVIGF